VKGISTYFGFVYIHSLSCDLVLLSITNYKYAMFSILPLKSRGEQTRVDFRTMDSAPGDCIICIFGRLYGVVLLMG